MGLKQQRAKQVSQRIKTTVVRTESQPYSFIGQTRQPRLSASASLLYCVPSASIAARTANPTGGTVSSITGQTVYTWNGTADVVITSTARIYNLLTAGVVSGKVAWLTPIGGSNSYAVVSQSCT
jgi:hypothetical protein